MKIGNVELDNKVFLSPMAGVTDLPFRLICKEQNCGMLYTEMINAKALCYDDANTKKMLKIEEEEHPVAVQIFGSDPEFMGRAAQIMNEVKLQLGIDKRNKTQEKCKECNKKELEEENSRLRDFAAYNMINTEAKSLLHIIYNEKYIDTDKFKSKIIQGYKKRNKKNIKFTKKEIDKIARNKYDAIFDGLKFLNIIEPSEDDKTIKLTQDGKKFVEKYIEKKEVV